MHFKNVYRSYLLNYPALFPVICVLVIQWNLAADFFPFAKSCIPVCVWCSHSGWQSCQSGPSFIWLALFYSVWLPLNADADKNVFAVFKSADFDWSVFIAVVNELFEMRTIKKKWCSTGARHSLWKKTRLLFDFLQYFRPWVISSISCVAGMLIDWVVTYHRYQMIVPVSV